jgi:hypothetical protein
MACWGNGPSAAFAIPERGTNKRRFSVDFHVWKMSS